MSPRHTVASPIKQRREGESQRQSRFLEVWCSRRLRLSDLVWMKPVHLFSKSEPVVFRDCSSHLALLLRDQILIFDNQLLF